MRRAAKRVVPVLLSLAAALLFLAWLGGRESALQWLAQRAAVASDGRLQLEGVSGSLYGPIRIAHFAYDGGSVRVTGEQLELRWRLARLWRPEVVISSLVAGEIGVENGGTPSPTPQTADSKPLPLSLVIQRARIARLKVAAGKPALTFSAVELTGRLDAEAMRADVRSNGGALRATASLTLNAARAFQLSAELTRLDLAALMPAPPSTINASLTSRGSLEPFSLSADWRIDDSRFNDAPLASRGRVRWTGRHLAQLEATLRLADNEVRAAGSFGRPDDVLTWRLSLPRLAKFGQGFSGRVQAEGGVRGGMAHPTVEFKLAADGLVFFGEHRLQQMRAHGRFGAGADDAFSADAVALGYRGPGVELDRGEAHVGGTRSAHRISLLLRNPQWHLTADARGEWAGQSWRGEVVHLANRGAQAFALQAPAKLMLARDGIDISGAKFDIAGGALTLARLVQRAGALHTQGQAAGIVLERLRPFLPETAFAYSSSLLLDARWDIKVGETVDGELNVTRRQGDIVLGSHPALPLGLTQMAGDAQIVRNRVRIAMTVAGTEVGRLQAQAQMQLARRNGLWTLPPDAPFALTAGAQVPSLSWLGKFSPAPLTLAGRLHADLQASGTLGAPQWRGTLQGSGLALKEPNQGLDWRGGTLAAQLEGSRLKVQRLVAQAGEGKLQLQGWVAVNGASGDLQLTAQQALVTRTPTREIVASGDGHVRLRERALDINGDIRVDRARITLPKQEGPTLSHDVVVVGREEEEEAHAPLPFSPKLKVNIDFGERFYVKGHGVDARLAGSIELRATDSGLPVGRGSVRVAEGTYSAYGQRLQIDRGVLTFNGPIDNPALDILALRKNQEVQAGVAITGTALNPVVKLVSIPEVPDSEKLAWLVLGHGLNQASGKDFDLLNAAAASILARGESVSLQAQIAQRFGLDEFRVSGRGELEETIVTLGKKLSSDVYVAYQRSVSGTTNVFIVKYKLTPRWSLQTQASPIETAADFLFTLSFD